MISLLWSTAGDWWGEEIPRPSLKERKESWHEFVDRLAIACRTDPVRAERLFAWKPLQDMP